MLALIRSIMGEHFFAGLAALLLGVVAYQAVLMLRDERARDHRRRRHIRREFWGYD